MATPIVLFQHETPVQFTCGTLRDVTVTVEPMAVGKGKVRLFITAPSCRFDNGGKEIVREFVATTATDAIVVVFNLSITCALPQIYTIVLAVEATNSANETGDDRITAKANCQKTVAPTTSTTKVVI